eukprot:2757758-Karenia_brevis.AAC.1
MLGAAPWTTTTTYLALTWKTDTSISAIQVLSSARKVISRNLVQVTSLGLRTNPNCCLVHTPNRSGASTNQGIRNAVSLSIHHRKNKGRVVFEWQERYKAWRNPYLQQLATGYGDWHETYVSWVAIRTELN